MVAGHLALLDLANAIDDPDGPARVDHIATFPGLLSWSVRAGALLTAARSAPPTSGGKPATSRGGGTDKSSHAVLSPRSQQHARRRCDPPRLSDNALGAAAAFRQRRDQPRRNQADNRRSRVAAVGPATSDDLECHALAHRAGSTRLADRPRSPHRVKRCAGCPWRFLDQLRRIPVAAGVR